MCKNHFSPVQCILPPYLTDKLVESDDKNISKIAVNTKFRSFRLRSDREFFKDTSTKEQAFLCALPKKSKVPVLKMEVYNCNRKPSTTGATLMWKESSAKLPADKDAKNVINAGSGTW